MATSAIEEQPSSHGFDFSNHARNQFLGARMGGLPKGQFHEFPALKEETTDDIATSTGTTIVGVKFGGGSSGEEEGVCLGADTRATGGSIVADKNCEKVSLVVLHSEGQADIPDPLPHSPDQVLWCWYRSGHRVSLFDRTRGDQELTFRFVTNLIASNLEVSY